MKPSVTLYDESHCSNSETSSKTKEAAFDEGKIIQKIPLKLYLECCDMIIIMCGFL
jgi:hypothetical protein